MVLSPISGNFAVSNEKELRHISVGSANRRLMLLRLLTLLLLLLMFLVCTFSLDDDDAVAIALNVTTVFSSLQLGFCYWNPLLSRQRSQLQT